jgi:hypothetical protein
MQLEVDSMLPIISYIRVSDKKQGRSGLGLKAQQQAIDRFTQFEGLKVVKKNSAGCRAMCISSLV